VGTEEVYENLCQGTSVKRLYVKQIYVVSSKVQIGARAHPPSYAVATGGYVSGCKTAGA
jgi:hypothetical protein